MSSSNRVRLSIIREVTKGVTPNTPAMQVMRWLSESLNYNTQNVQSDEIRDDRSKGPLVLVGHDVAGDISFEMSHGTFNTLLEAAFCSSFTGTTTKLLVNGSTIHYHSVLKQFMDLTTTQMTFKGCVVDAMSLSFQKRAKVEGSFSLMGMDVDTVLTTGSTFLPITTSPVWNTSSNVVSITMDAVPMTSCVDKVSLNIKNGVRPITCLGKKGAVEFDVGDFDLTGSMDLYFKDLTTFNQYKNGTKFALAITIEDDLGNDTIISMPQVQFETLSVVAGGGNQDVMASGTIKASKGSANHVIQWSSTP